MTEAVFTCLTTPTDAQVEAICGQLGLQATMKGSLKTLGANTHWHYKMPCMAGVLEITLMHTTHQVIFSCKENRMGAWIAETIQKLVSGLGLRPEKEN